jgi:hypothetical protein
MLAIARVDSTKATGSVLLALGQYAVGDAAHKEFLARRCWIAVSNQTAYLRVHGSELYELRTSLPVSVVAAADGGFFVELPAEPIRYSAVVEAAMRVVGVIDQKRRARGLASLGPFSEEGAQSMLAMKEKGQELGQFQEYAARLWDLANQTIRADESTSRAPRDPATVVNPFRSKVRKDGLDANYLPLGRNTIQLLFESVDAIENRLNSIERQLAHDLRDNDVQERPDATAFAQILRYFQGDTYGD